MKHIEGIFKSVRGSSIYYQACLPNQEVNASVIILHGLGEHSGRYENVVNHLTPLGFALYGFDLIGHGKSEGEREFVRQYQDFKDTLTIYKNKVISWQPDKPLFLLGHSMGGLIAAEYLLDHSTEFEGAIISAPLLSVPDNINRFTVLAGKLFSIIAPRIGITELDPNAISRDSEVVQAYIDDPLVFHGKTTARLSVELLKAIMRVNDQVARIALPLIVLQGGDDRLVNPQVSTMFYEGASSQDKILRIYDGLYHEVFNEPEHAEVLSDVAAWLKDRI